MLRLRIAITYPAPASAGPSAVAVSGGASV
jgi:hypothetical protein